MPSNTADLAAVQTCRLERVDPTAISIRHSGAGYNCHEGVSEWCTGKMSDNSVGGLYIIPLPHSRADNDLASITTMTTLLALHIESALDSTETYLIRSISRISISQTMLVLTQGREIPALKRALPIFEEILTKNNLYLVPPDSLGQSNCKSRR